MKSRAIIFLLPVLSLFFSCSHHIHPEKPIVSDNSSRLDSLPDSEINIPIQISLQPVYAMAEKKVDTLFTSPDYPNQWVQEGCDTRFKYSFRRGPLQINATGTFMDLAFTGYYKIIGSTRLCVNGTVVSPWTPPCQCGFNEPERRVNVSFTNTATILPDYKVKLSFHRNEPQPLDKCEVCFWGQNITKQVMKGLVANLDAARDDLDSHYGSIDLKSRFQLVWDQLNKAFDIYGLGWLQINPQRIHVNNLFARNDSLNIYLGISARPVITFEKPPPKSSWVPSLGQFSKQPGFNIFLDAVLNYDSLSNIMNHQLSGTSFNLDKGPVKKTFIINECRLFGTGNDKLIIRVKFSGSETGTVYFTGKPSYDPDAHVIEIKDIDFDVRSKDALLKAADWIFNRKIINEISHRARFDLAAYIDSAKSTLDRQLNREWTKGLRSTGKIADIKLIGIYPRPQSLIIRSNCSGELALRVDSIPFSL